MLSDCIDRPARGGASSLGCVIGIRHNGRLLPSKSEEEAESACLSVCVCVCQGGHAEMVSEHFCLH